MAAAASKKRSRGCLRACSNVALLAGMDAKDKAWSLKPMQIGGFGADLSDSGRMWQSSLQSSEISIAHADLIIVKNWCRLSTVFHVECRVALV